jgi:hypothetical protein
LTPLVVAKAAIVEVINQKKVHKHPYFVLDYLLTGKHIYIAVDAS